MRVWGCGHSNQEAGPEHVAKINKSAFGITLSLHSIAGSRGSAVTTKPACRSGGYELVFTSGRCEKLTGSVNKSVFTSGQCETWLPGRPRTNRLTGRLWEVKTVGVIMATSPIDCRTVYKIGVLIPYIQSESRRVNCLVNFNPLLTRLQRSKNNSSAQKVAKQKMQCVRHTEKVHKMWNL